MRNPSVEERQQAILEILPNKADLQVLFPKEADKIWPLMEKYRQGMQANIAVVTKVLTWNPTVSVECLDVRKINPPEPAYAPLLAQIPPDILAYKIIKKGKHEKSEEALYLHVNGRWIHLKGNTVLLEGLEENQAEVKREVTVIRELKDVKFDATDPATSLAVALLKLEEAMQNSSAEMRRKAYLDLQPTKADLQLLFPQVADRLWPYYDTGKITAKDSDSFAKSWNYLRTVSFKLYNVRAKDPDDEYGGILKMIPPETPFFLVDRYAVSTKSGTGGYSYMYANGHWFFMREIEQLPEFISSLPPRESSNRQ